MGRHLYPYSSKPLYAPLQARPDLNRSWMIQLEATGHGIHELIIRYSVNSK